MSVAGRTVVDKARVAEGRAFMAPRGQGEECS